MLELKEYLKLANDDKMFKTLEDYSTDVLSKLFVETVKDLVSITRSITNFYAPSYSGKTTWSDFIDDNDVDVVAISPQKGKSPYHVINAVGDVTTVIFVTGIDWQFENMTDHSISLNYASNIIIINNSIKTMLAYSQYSKNKLGVDPAIHSFYVGWNQTIPTIAHRNDETRETLVSLKDRYNIKDVAVCPASNVNVTDRNISKDQRNDNRDKAFEEYKNYLFSNKSYFNDFVTLRDGEFLSDVMDRYIASILNL